MVHILTSFFLILSLVFSGQTASAAFVPQVNTYYAAGQTYALSDSQFGNTSGKYVKLYCSAWDGTTTRGYGGCEDMSSATNSPYTVPGSLTLNIKSVVVISGSTSACTAQLIYATSGITAAGSNTVPTGVVGDMGFGGFPILIGSNVPGVRTEFFNSFAIPTGKQVGVQMVTSNACVFYVIGQLN